MGTINLKQIYIIVFFIIFPFFSLPILFCEIYNGKKYPLVLLAIFMGGLSMFYFPYGDQYRYFTQLEIFKYLSFDEIFDFESILIFKELNIVNILIFVAAKIGLNLEIVRFLLTFTSCILLFNIFINLRELRQIPHSKILSLLTFVVLFLSVPYYLINYGFRTGFGACLLTYGIYLIYIRNNFFKGLFFFLLAASTHFFFIIHSLLFGILYFIDFHLNKKYTLILTVVLFFCSMSIFSSLLGKLDFIDSILNSYVYGDEYGAGSYDYFSPKSKPLWLNGIINSVLMFYLFFQLNKKGKLENIIHVLFILCVFAIPFATFFQRMIRSSIPILAIYLIMNFENRIVYKVRYILISVLMIAFLSPFWVARKQYRYSQLNRVFYSSLPVILNNHYNEKTISTKVDRFGEWYD